MEHVYDYLARIGKLHNGEVIPEREGTPVEGGATLVRAQIEATLDLDARLRALERQAARDTRA